MEAGKDNIFPAPQEGPLLDHELLGKTLGGHKALIIKSMEMFFKTGQDQLDGIRAAIAADNNTDLQTHAHSLKGIVGYFNQGEVHRLCAGLQFAGRDGRLPADKDRIAGEFERLEGLVAALCVEMRETVARLSGGEPDAG